ncbi:cell division protein FtsW [Xylanimonas oleitrophica]|uniref:Probable peptidoglycan glycosyltransferase FtsW n=1 Tax=Xylanimonas oleitrophica TaxID=2607479 RepID=A0A2W5X4M3_9MICO|nr:putative peptidoglycan glycosyltransferase FtsW [Xylanimonas oleitrophica]PZR55445.1 cell division protein FtsW [Xylanimonas oleitrophica]
MAVTTGPRAPRTDRGGQRPWLGQWNSSVTSYYLLVGASGLLLVFGLVMVLSSSTVTSIADGESPYAEFLRQGQFVLLGLPVMLVATRLPVRVYKALAWPGLFVAVALQSLTFVPAFALSKGGNTGWIGFGSFTMQPAEVGKLVLAVWLGTVLGRKHHLLGSWKHAFLPAVPGAGLLLVLVLGGRDLGTAMIVAALVAGAFWVAGAPAKMLAVLGGSAATVVLYLFLFSASHGGNRLNRISAAYGECTDVQGTCYQALHGMYGLGTGGLFGVGLGASREKWKYLPEAHNDFVYAIIGEELGLFGTLMVLMLFVVLGVAMSRVVRRHPDPFVKVTTAAVGCWVVGQAFLNIGVVIGVLPVIGVPLPLVSAGGSALVTTMAALGMVISFARTEPGAEQALAARGSAVRRSLAVVGRGRGRR